MHLKLYAMFDKGKYLGIIPAPFRARRDSNARPFVLGGECSILPSYGYMWRCCYTGGKKVKMRMGKFKEALTKIHLSFTKGARHVIIRHH